MPLYITFIDLTKAFDLVSRQGIFQLLKKIGCPPAPSCTASLLPFTRICRVLWASTGKPLSPSQSGVGLNKGVSLRRHSLAFFHLRCLRRILGITWQDKVTNTALLGRAGSHSIHLLLLCQHRLRWLHPKRCAVWGAGSRTPSRRPPGTAFQGCLQARS